jgi:hypothetical protein
MKPIYYISPYKYVANFNCNDKYIDAMFSTRQNKLITIWFLYREHDGTSGGIYEQLNANNNQCPTIEPIIV